MPRVGSHAVILQPLAHEADNLPVLVGQDDAFVARDRVGKRLVLLCRVDQIALCVSRRRARNVVCHSERPHFSIARPRLSRSHRVAGHFFNFLAAAFDPNQAGHPSIALAFVNCGGAADTSLGKE